MQIQSFQPPCPQENFKYQDGKHFLYFCQNFLFLKGLHLKMDTLLQCYSDMTHLHVGAGGEASRYEG
jgi:hypothetical protein